MIGVATTIKDDTTDTVLPGTLGDQLTHLACNRYFSIADNTLQRLDRSLLHTFLRAGQLGFDLSSRLATPGGSSLLWRSAFCRGLRCLGPFSPGLCHLRRHLRS